MEKKNSNAMLCLTHITDEEEGGEGGGKSTIFMKHCQVNAMQHLLDVVMFNLAYAPVIIH